MPSLDTNQKSMFRVYMWKTIKNDKINQISKKVEWYSMFRGQETQYC